MKGPRVRKWMNENDGWNDIRSKSNEDSLTEDRFNLQHDKDPTWWIKKLKSVPFASNQIGMASKLAYCCHYGQIDKFETLHLFTHNIAYLPSFLFAQPMKHLFRDPSVWRLKSFRQILSLRSRVYVIKLYFPRLQSTFRSSTAVCYNFQPPPMDQRHKKYTRGHTALGRKERYYSMRCTSYRMKGKVLLKAFSIHDHQTQLILCRLAHLFDFPCRSKTGQRVFKLHVRTRLEWKPPGEEYNNFRKESLSGSISTQ